MARRSERAVLAVALLAVVVFLFLRERTAPEPLPVPAAPAPRPPRPADGATPTDPKSPTATVSSPDTHLPAPDAAAMPVADLRIHGSTLDRGGAGIPGVRIEVRAWSGDPVDSKWSVFGTKSDAKGAFEVAIDKRLATLGFGIAADAEGFVEGWRHVPAGAYDEAAGADLVLDAARSIAGRVLDEYGRPIPGTKAQFWYGTDTTWPTDTDENGCFRSPCRLPMRDLEVFVEAPGFPMRRIEVYASEDDYRYLGDIMFQRGGRVAGVAVDAAGNPVPDLSLVLTGIAGGLDRAPRTKTNGAGLFEFLDVGEGTVGVIVDGPAGPGGPPGARREYRGGISDVVVGSVDVRVPVRTETRVKIRFVDATTGSPIDVVKAEYGLRAEGTPAPERLGHGASGSDPLTSTILSVWAGRYDLTVRSPGFEDADLKGVEVPDRPEATVDVPMRRKP
jgi:hypothetical protein